MRLPALITLLSLAAFPAFAGNLYDESAKAEWHRATDKADADLSKCWADAEVQTYVDKSTACAPIKEMINRIVDKCSAS
ncbi:hypothetical protein [Rhizobium sp. Leaf311]|uniref:hypothetical protein n=1 Tax=Rhizobium sp. Leaf311 TaxID=1736332 RepID=UPI000B2A1087|nr:hypothetical protein [Rhizobium sp. Leaf311]